MSGDPPKQLGPYLVYEELGVGGMATVHRAELRGSDGFRKQIALKRLHPHIAAVPELLKAFVHEARLASHMRHTNVAQTFELGRVATTYFISMEYVPGPTLTQLIRQSSAIGAAIPLPVVLSILTQICDALDHAHNCCDDSGAPLGIVHRDVSPSNVILSNTGIVKLIDFGVAKGAGSDLRTKTGLIKGKFGYVAPEYIAGQLDARADLFGLGVIAHEMLTNRPLFTGVNDYETLTKLREMEVPLPSRVNPAVPPDLDDIVMTALQRDPGARWQSASAMRTALANVIRELAISVTHQQVVQWVEWAFSQLPRDDEGETPIPSPPTPPRLAAARPTLPRPAPAPEQPGQPGQPGQREPPPAPIPASHSQPIATLQNRLTASVLGAMRITAPPVLPPSSSGASNGRAVARAPSGSEIETLEFERFDGFDSGVHTMEERTIELDREHPTRVALRAAIAAGASGAPAAAVTAPAPPPPPMASPAPAPPPRPVVVTAAPRSGAATLPPPAVLAAPAPRAGAATLPPPNPLSSVPPAGPPPNQLAQGSVSPVPVVPRSAPPPSAPPPVRSAPPPMPSAAPAPSRIPSLEELARPIPMTPDPDAPAAQFTSARQARLIDPTPASTAIAASAEPPTLAARPRSRLLKRTSREQPPLTAAAAPPSAPSPLASTLRGTGAPSSASPAASPPAAAAALDTDVPFRRKAVSTGVVLVPPRAGGADPTGRRGSVGRALLWSFLLLLAIALGGGAVVAYYDYGLRLDL